MNYNVTSYYYDKSVNPMVDLTISTVLKNARTKPIPVEGKNE
jgi:hypothetical protein